MQDVQEDVWQEKQPAALPPASPPSVEQQQQIALARLQQQVGAIRQQKLQPTVERIVPRVAAGQQDPLALAIPIAALAIAGILGGGAMLMGSQPRQYDAAVIQQLAENNKILAQSRPSVVCVLAVNCPDDSATQQATEPAAPMPLVSSGATQAIAPTPSEFTQWLAFFSSLPQSELENYRAYLEQNNLVGTPQHQALMTLLDVPQAIAPTPAPMPVIN